MPDLSNTYVRAAVAGLVGVLVVLALSRLDIFEGVGTFIVIGLADGVVYGLAALGLVLIYKGSRVFNFAQGEFGTLAMYVLFFFHETWNWPYFIAAILALGAATLFGLATERLVARPLANAPKVIALVGTAGVGLLAIGLQLVFFKPEPRAISPAIGGSGLGLLGFIVSPQKLLSLGVLVIVAVSAAFFFQRTYLGTAILANSMDSTAARLMGANTNRISAVTWGIAGLMGGVAGVLIAPDSTLVPGYMTTNILIPAFTAAIVGGMTSLVGAFVGGQIVGLVGAMWQYAAGRVEALQVIPEGSAVALFVVLILVMVIRPKGLFGAEA